MFSRRWLSVGKYYAHCIQETMLFVPVTTVLLFIYHLNTHEWSMVRVKNRKYGICLLEQEKKCIYSSFEDFGCYFILLKMNQITKWNSPVA